MPQSAEVSPAAYRQRIEKLQAAMKELGFGAVVLEPGPAMVYLTGVRWGKSERTFVVVLPAKGEPVWVLPGFEEGRARELIHVGDGHPRVAGGREPLPAHCRRPARSRACPSGRVAIDDGGALLRVRRHSQAGAQARLFGGGAGVEAGRRQRAVNVLRILARGAASAGAVGSVALALYVGRRSASPLLPLIFAVWVIAPFLGVLFADLVWKRGGAMLHALMLVLAVGSLAIYGWVAFGPPMAKPAGVFLLAPAASWISIGAVALFSRRRGSRAAHLGSL